MFPFESTTNGLAGAPVDPPPVTGEFNGLGECFVSKSAPLDPPPPASPGGEIPAAPFCESVVACWVDNGVASGPAMLPTSLADGVPDEVSERRSTREAPVPTVEPDPLEEAVKPPAPC